MVRKQIEIDVIDPFNELPNTIQCNTIQYKTNLTIPSIVTNNSFILPIQSDLQVYNNTLQYEIPRELFFATGLETLRLDYNFFSGILPTEIGALVKLKVRRCNNRNKIGRAHV